MKFARLIPALLCAALTLTCCTDELDEDRFDKGVNTDDKKPDGGQGDKEEDKPSAYIPTADDLAVDRTLFELLNLDYSPLAEVKALYNEKKYKQASDALLFYFKNRKDVVNPEVTIPVLDITYIRQGADDALPENDYRFCVHSANYYESYVGGKYQYYSFKNPDGSINWEFEAPNVGTEFYQKHWHAWFLSLAQVYSYTKDEKYFQAWKDQYTDWMKNYPCPSTGERKYTNTVGTYGYKSWCELSMATRIDSQSKLFYYFIPSAGFDFAWLTAFLKAYHETVEYSMGHLYYTENSNIRFSQYKSHCLAGCFFPEFKKASSWLNAGADAVAGAFNISFLDDGCLEEFDMGYHTGEVENYRLVYNAAKANGMLAHFPADYLSKLYKSCAIVADYLYPNYLWECFNETKQQTKNVTKRWMGYYSEMFPEDQKFLYLASDRAKGEKPAETLSIYKTSGYYMFHAGWDVNSMMLIFKNHYNPKNMWHSHLDNGNVSLYNKGRIFMPSSGSYTYGDNTGGQLDKERDEHKAARNHNTLTKGLADIGTSNSLGKFLTSYSKDGVDCVVTENPSYTDLTHRRAVWMVDKSFYVIADAASGSSAGSTLNLSWHLCRDTALGENVVVTDDDRAHLAYGAHTVFPDGNNMIFKTFSDTSDGYSPETGSSYYSEAIGSRQSRKYYRINVTKKTASSNPRFITVIYPCSDASKVKIDASFTSSSFSTSGESVKVTIDGKEYILSYSIN